MSFVSLVGQKRGRVGMEMQISVGITSHGASLVTISNGLFKENQLVDFQVDEDNRVFRIIKSNTGKKIPKNRRILCSGSVAKLMGTGRFNVEERSDGWYGKY